MIKEFPNRGWKKSTLNRLIQEIDATGISSRKTPERIRMALIIDSAIDQWFRRINAAVAARGRHIEYSFD